MWREEMEKQLAHLPLYQYAFLSTADIRFSERVRWICEHECPMYNSTWACPPAVGSVAECEKRVRGYAGALLMATVAEVSDAANLTECLLTRAPHEEITRQALEMVQGSGKEAMALSTEACAICQKCAWPAAPCRHPEKMFPCVESHGILVTELAEAAGMDFFTGSNIITWYSLILYR